MEQDYPGILKSIKIANPKLSHKEAQKEASRMFQKYKEAQADSIRGDKMPDPPADSFRKSSETTAPAAVPKGTIDAGALAEAERRIRAKGVDLNSIRGIGGEFIPGGEIREHGRDGVNTRVTFEDFSGNKIPASGYFLVFIAR